MFYVVESDKSFYEATVDLEAVIPRLGFVIFGIRDLGAILRGKGIDLDDECKVFDVGNYRQMEKMLAVDMRLSPTCRGAFRYSPKTGPPRSA